MLWTISCQLSSGRFVNNFQKVFKMYISRYSAKKNREHNNVQFEIHAISSLSQEMQERKFLPIFHEAYSIIWIRKGSGEINIDMGKYDIDEKSMYYARPGQAIACDIHESAKGFIISFAKEFLDLYEKDSAELSSSILFNPFLSKPVIKIDDEMDSFFENIAEQMVHEFRQPLKLRSEILKGFLKIFILYINRHVATDCQNNFQSRKTGLVSSFYALLEKNYTTKKMVKEYAEILAVTPNYLNETVKELSGFSASHHIQQRLILEAKRRAVYEGYSMKEISYYLGFLDPSHFSKFFKNIAGTNFTDFKKGAHSRPLQWISYIAENGCIVHDLIKFFLIIKYTWSFR